MMNQFWIVFAALLLVATPIEASLILTTPGVDRISGVTVNKSATVFLNGKFVPMHSSGAGLRTKSVAKIKAYVAQLYVSNLPRLQTPELTPLQAIDSVEMKAIALEMSLLHSATTYQMTNSFQYGLMANGIDPWIWPYKDLITAIGSAGGYGRGDGRSKAVLMGQRLADGTEQIVYENSETRKIVTVKGHKGFIRDIFAIWLGVPYDKGMAVLQDGLLSKSKGPGTNWSSVLKTVPGTERISGVVINKSASTEIEKTVVQLTPTGAGLRTKTIANVKVYVAQLYVSNLQRFRDPNLTPLQSLDFDDMKVVALQMNLLHSVTADQMGSSFKDGLRANGIDSGAKPYSDLLASIASTGNYSKTDGTTTAVMMGQRLADGTEQIVYENSETQKLITFKGPKGFIKDIFSIWLGNPADSGLGKLKTALIGP